MAFVIGLVVGIVAVYSLPGKDSGGGIIPVMLGIIASVMGTAVVLIIYRIVIAKYARTAN